MTTTTEAPANRNQPRIVEWEVEHEEFWRRTGSKIAFRNLLISIPCLLFAFAIWLYWSIVIVQMQNLNFPYSTAQLYTLPASRGCCPTTRWP